MSAAPRTVREVLAAGAGFLEGKGPENPRLACEMLLSRLLGCKRLDLYLQYDRVLDEPRLAAMRRGVKRLAAGEPVQYILGETEFMGHGFKVDRRALIPRPETELLTEAVLNAKALWEGDASDGSGVLLADVGTGCGCIAVSLALARPAARCVAFDISAEALDLARANARAHGVEERVAFVHGELSDGLEPGMVSAVTANLPYVPTAEYEKLPPHIREHEPRAALDGGDDGLAVIRDVIADAAIALQVGGFLFLETGTGQGAAVRSLLEKSGFEQIEIRPDLAGHDRIAVGRMSVVT